MTDIPTIITSSSDVNERYVLKLKRIDIDIYFNMYSKLFYELEKMEEYNNIIGLADCSIGNAYMWKSLDNIFDFKKSHKNINNLFDIVSCKYKITTEYDLSSISKDDKCRSSWLTFQ
jgi:hypothetical protein